MSLIESTLTCLFPVLAITCASIIFWQVICFEKKRLTSKVFRDYLLGALCGFALYPIGHILSFLLFVAVCLMQNNLSLHGEMVTNFDFTHELSIWVDKLLYLVLVSFGPTADLGIIVGASYRLVKGNQIGKSTGYLTHQFAVSKFEMAVILALSVVGWSVLSARPLPDWSVQPPL